MNALEGSVGEVKMTLEIKRKETGKVEKVELVGFINQEQLDHLKGTENGNDSQHGSPQRGD